MVSAYISKGAFKHFKGLITYLSIIIMNVSCLTKVHYPPPTSPVSITIRNIYADCHNPLSSSAPINWALTFTGFYYDNSNSARTNFASYTYKTNSTNPPTDYTFTYNLPNDGTTFGYDIQIDGTQCSTCALTQDGFYHYCYQYQDPANPNATKAGIPSVRGEVNNQVYPSSTLIIYFSLNGRIQNVSCGCSVPNN